MNFVFNQDDFKYLCKKYQDFEYEIRPLANGFTLMNWLFS